MPTGYGEAGYHQRAGTYRPPKPKTRGSTGGGSRYAQDAAEKKQQADYLQQLQAYLYGGQQQYGQMPQQQTSYRRGGGGGGGGGYRPSAYESFQIAQEKKRQDELNRKKLELTGQLMGARNQAIPLLNQYGHQYGADINRIYGENRGMNAGYARQLQAIAQQMHANTAGQQAGLRRDLVGQGANSELGAMNAMAGQNNAGYNYLNLLGQQYNTSLAQAMANAQADARSMGAAIKASSLGNLQNSYANQLAQIGLIGLQ